MTWLKEKIAYARGILNKRKAYNGPHLLQFNITNFCNFNCIGCYFHSPLRNERFSDEWEKQKMPRDVILRLVDEAAQIKTSKILLTGNGEPTLYPALYDTIERIKNHKMGCLVSTNGVIIDEEMLFRFHALRLDALLLSLFPSL
mgnify:CR=1 FL=1